MNGHDLVVIAQSVRLVAYAVVIPAMFTWGIIAIRRRTIGSSFHRFFATAFFSCLLLASVFRRDEDLSEGFLAISTVFVVSIAITVLVSLWIEMKWHARKLERKPPPHAGV